MTCNHPTTITIADCWTEERNDAGMNCYECEKCGILLEKHPSCDVHYDNQRAYNESMDKRQLLYGAYTCHAVE